MEYKDYKSLCDEDDESFHKDLNGQMALYKFRSIGMISLTQLTTHQYWVFCEVSQIEVTKQLNITFDAFQGIWLFVEEKLACRNLWYIQVRVVVKLGWVVVIPVFRFHSHKPTSTETTFFKKPDHILYILSDFYLHGFEGSLRNQMATSYWVSQKFNSPIKNL